MNYHLVRGAGAAISEKQSVEITLRLSPTFALWHKKRPWRSTRGKSLYHKLMGTQGFVTSMCGAKAAN